MYRLDFEDSFRLLEALMRLRGQDIYVYSQDRTLPSLSLEQAAMHRRVGY
jgi:hypothetical protein